MLLMRKTTKDDKTVAEQASATPEDWLQKAGILIEALPYMRRYANKPVVVKFGGHAMGEQEYVASFAADMTLLRQVGAQPIICLLYTSPSPRDISGSRMPSSA